MAGSHYTYIPWFKKGKKDEELEEVEKELKIPRLCVKCSEFKQFVFKKKEDFWFTLNCPTCEETIKLPTKKNLMATKWEKEKWK